MSEKNKSKIEDRGEGRERERERKRKRKRERERERGKDRVFWLQKTVRHYMIYYPGPKKEPSWWYIMWYRRICGLISLRCIDAWSRGSRKSRSLAVPQLNQAPWFLDITRFWFYASTAWFFFFFVQGSTFAEKCKQSIQHYTNIKKSTKSHPPVILTKGRACLCTPSLYTVRSVQGVRYEVSDCTVEPHPGWDMCGGHVSRAAGEKRIVVVHQDKMSHSKHEAGECHRVGRNRKGHKILENRTSKGKPRWIRETREDWNKTTWEVWFQTSH